MAIMSRVRHSYYDTIMAIMSRVKHSYYDTIMAIMSRVNTQLLRHYHGDHVTG